MKKISIMLSVLFLCLLINTMKTTAEDKIVYPFDSITITSAYKFNVSFTEAVAENSFLKGYVLPGETVTVYVGNLDFTEDGVANYLDESLIVITNESGVDVLKWMTNGYSLTDTGKYYEFSSHKTIDPNIGVVKELTDHNIQAVIFISNDNVYHLIDNTGKEYEMIPGSFTAEQDLNIVVSAYTEE